MRRGRGCPILKADRLAYALLGAACAGELMAEQVYLALITPPQNPDHHAQGLPSWWPIRGVSGTGHGSPVVWPGQGCVAAYDGVDLALRRYTRWGGAAVEVIIS
jgi:hypothetical protein